MGTWKNFARKGVVLSLLAVLCLSGCAGGEEGAAAVTPTPSPTESQEPEPSESPMSDYTKYNTYLELINYVYEMEDCLTDYFTEVAYQEQFQIAEGGVFTDLHPSMEVFNTPFFIDEDPFEAALAQIDEQPAYEGLDQAMEQFIPAAQAVDTALRDIAEYVSDYTYSEDNYEGIVSLHAALWPLLEPYYTQLDAVMVQLEAVEQVLREEDLNGLLERDEVIAYHSNYIFFGIEDLYALAYQEENVFGDEVYIQDVAGFEAICTETKEAAAAMLEALEDPDQRAKVSGLHFWTEDDNDWEYQHYKSYQYYGQTVMTQMDEMAEKAGQGADLGADLRSFYYDYEYMIDAYNSYIVG